MMRLPIFRKMRYAGCVRAWLATGTGEAPSTPFAGGIRPTRIEVQNDTLRSDQRHLVLAPPPVMFQNAGDGLPVFDHVSTFKQIIRHVPENAGDIGNYTITSSMK